MGENQEKSGEKGELDQGLEQALGKEMLEHFQFETARLQSQNEVLLRAQGRETAHFVDHAVFME